VVATTGDPTACRSRSPTTPNYGGLGCDMRTVALSDRHDFLSRSCQMFLIRVRLSTLGTTPLALAGPTDAARVLFGSTRRRVLDWLLGHPDEAIASS
jgi:hypothetical protein